MGDDVVERFVELGRALVAELIRETVGHGGIFDAMNGVVRGRFPRKFQLPSGLYYSGFAESIGVEGVDVERVVGAGVARSSSHQGFYEFALTTR